MSRVFNANNEESGPATSVSLLQLACRGDDQAWCRLVRVYGPIVYGWARRSCLQAADAADVMQETFLAVARSLTDFDHQAPGGSFRGWLWTITRHKLIDRNRRLARQPRAAGGSAAQHAWMQVVQAEPLSQNQPPSDVSVDAALLRSRLLKELEAQFLPRAWRMFWETAIVGRAAEDVAAEMGTSKWAIYKARARVLQKLQEEMRDLL